MSGSGATVDSGRAWPRVIAALAWLTLAAGCTPVARDALHTLRIAAIHPAPVVPTPAQVLARPYFQMQVEQARHTAVLVLGNIDGGRQAWYSSDGKILFLREGVLVKTSGLPQDLEATALPPDSPFLSGLQRLAGPIVSARRIDLSPGYRYGVAVASQLSPGPLETIDVLGQSHQVRRIDEHVRAESLDWQADNHYWVDPADGFIWKSQQSVPGDSPLILTMLRPYREEAP